MAAVESEKRGLSYTACHEVHAFIFIFVILKQTVILKTVCFK